jgi:DNA-directed RNA polymerase specialized sigma24 family protein
LEYASFPAEGEDMNGGRSSSAEVGALRATASETTPENWDWDRLDAHLRPRLVSVGERRFGLTPEEAEDVLQDTFESVFTKRPRVRNMEGYLVGAFFNRCVDRLAERTGERSHEGPLDPNLPDAVTVRQIVDGVHVRSAFRLLTPGCQRLIHAYCILRQSLAEAAADAGCTVPAVWKRLNQCMKRMRGCLG